MLDSFIWVAAAWLRAHVIIHQALCLWYEHFTVCIITLRKKWLSSELCWNTAVCAVFRGAVLGLLNVQDSQFLTSLARLAPSTAWVRITFIFLQQGIQMDQHSDHAWLSALKQSRACICLPWASNKKCLFCLLYGLHSFNELEKPLNIPHKRRNNKRQMRAIECLKRNPLCATGKTTPSTPCESVERGCKIMHWKENLLWGRALPCATTAVREVA